MSYKANLVLNLKSTLGEGPHWDYRQKVLYWVDILEKKLHVFDPDANIHRFIQFDQYIGTIVPGRPGTLILAMQNGIHLYDLKTEQLTKIVDPEEDKPNNRFNDGKCDPSGRFWGGTMDLDGKKGCGTLYRLETDSQIQPIIPNVSISNGLAWSPNREYMYFIDTPTSEVSVYKYDDKSGDISFLKTGVRIPAEMGSPDGMTIDNEGMIWVAHWGGAKVTRWDPHHGNLLDEVHVPAKNVTSCTFGGENLDELYITTASTGMSDSEWIDYPNSGGLFKVKTEVKGMRAFTFNNN